MIERVCLRRRLASATYHPSSPLEDQTISQEILSDQRVVVFPSEPSAEDVCRHVASKQSTGLPFFVMSLPRLHESLDLWKSSMSSISPFYSLRCNADPVLLRLLVDSDIGFEASDPILLETALDLVPPHRILYSNPCLTRKILQHAHESKVGMMTIETENDLFNCIGYAPDAKLLIRVCMSSYIRCYSNDVETQFGCTFPEARNLLMAAHELRANVIGISFNMGTDPLEPSLYNKALRAARQLMDEGREMGLPHLDTVCLGGGFNSIDKAHFIEAAEVINTAVGEFFPASSSIRVISTPGRFFAGPAFTLCTTVITKRTTEAQILTNDDFDEGPGYIYQTNEGVYGSFGCRLFDNCDPKCRPLSDLPHHLDLFHTTILGPNVDGTDVAQPLALLPQLSIGEWLLWDNMGAYSMPHDGEGPALPVYYYDSKKLWDNRHAPKFNQLSRIDSDALLCTSMGSEAGSEPGSDTESDEEDMSNCFRRVFRFDSRHTQY